VLSWVRRVGARYDLNASELAALLNDGHGVYASRVTCLDWQGDAELEALLAGSARLDVAQIRALRIVRVDGQEAAAWHRRSPAWCPRCLHDDVAQHGEVYQRAAWRLGCCVVCPMHRMRLVQTCGECTFGQCWFQAAAGRQRLVCQMCRRAVDVLPQARSTGAIDIAHPGLFGLMPDQGLMQSVLSIQADLLAALAGSTPGPAGLWRVGVPAEQFVITVRELAEAFLDPRRLGDGRNARMLADDEDAPARDACAFAALKAQVSFDLLGIVAGVVSGAVIGGRSDTRAAERHVLKTRFVPVDLAWFTDRLSAGELDALQVKAKAWAPAVAAAVQDAVMRQMAARQRAAATRDRAREEAAWTRRAAARCAAQARKRIRERAARKRSR
jgi:hypothetical protein